MSPLTSQVLSAHSFLCELPPLSAKAFLEDHKVDRDHTVCVNLRSCPVNKAELEARSIRNRMRVYLDASLSKNICPIVVSEVTVAIITLVGNAGIIDQKPIE